MPSAGRAPIVTTLSVWFAFACQGHTGSELRAASNDLPATSNGTAPSASVPPNAASATQALPTPSAGGPAPTAAERSAPSVPTAGAAGQPAVAADLFDAAGNPLPQTEDRPSAQSPALERRLELLVRAIAEDKPEVALPSFFPVEAYSQVKAIAKPAQDWKRRLVAAFERNIHEYHRQLGADAPSLRLLRIEIPEPKVKWMKPGAEGNRVGYFRVLRSKLFVANAEGAEKALEVTSMISWRGEWYVVHLHGFE